MPPTSLLADPAIRLAGLRAPSFHRVARAGSAPARPRWLLLATLLMLLVGAAGYLGTLQPLATVMSASMAPTIDTGDVVVLQHLRAPAQVGDIVMVHVPDEARARYGYPPVVVHRVVAIGPDGQVSTKGDARKERDPFTVARETLTKKVVTHLPAAGQVFGFFSSTLGLLWLACGGMLFFGAPLLERQRRAQAQREDRDRVLEEAIQAAASAQAQLAEHLLALPAQLERAVALAVPDAPPAEFVVIAARPAPPPPPVPASPAPVPFTLELAAPPAPAWTARRPRFERSGARPHGALCAVGGPVRA